MMNLRRYLTSMYDWTGISSKLYKSFKGHLIVMILLFFAVIAGFLLFHGPIITNEVRLNVFAPVKIISTLDHIVIGMLGLILISNMINMFYIVVAKNNDIRIPLYLYITKAFQGIFHFFT